MKILLVEDDFNQVTWIKDGLHKSFPGVTIQVISTELAFRQSLPQISKDRPDVIILDVMLRWADPDPNLEPPPEEVRKEGFFLGGLRCARLLTEQRTTQKIPVILYSVLEHGDIARDLNENPLVHHLRKDSEYDPLVRAIQEATTTRPTHKGLGAPSLRRN